MHRDIRFLLVFLIIALAILVWIQNQSCSVIPNTGQMAQHFTTDNNEIKPSYNKINEQYDNINIDPKTSNKIKGLIKKEVNEDKKRSSRESQKVTSRIIDNILKNDNENNNRRYELDSIIGENDNLSEDTVNPLVEDINSERNSLLDSDQQVLDELIKEVNTGNNLIVDNPRSELFERKTRSINAAKKYRKISYKDSEYRYDFDDNGDPTQESQDELNSMYDDALVFRNNEYNTNDNFKGFNVSDELYGNADLNNFKTNGPQTQQEKIISLYNSNEYLPNNNLLDKKLTKGFQILDNPVSVSNPNLIPVLKSIPVSSVLGSNRNQTYDIRSEPPCPKTVVSPFLNSSIMPDIYATQRGCL